MLDLYTRKMGAGEHYHTNVAVLCLRFDVVLIVYYLSFKNMRAWEGSQDVLGDASGAGRQ